MRWDSCLLGAGSQCRLDYSWPIPPECLHAACIIVQQSDVLAIFHCGYLPILRAVGTTYRELDNRGDTPLIWGAMRRGSQKCQVCQPFPPNVSQCHSKPQRGRCNWCRRWRITDIVQQIDCPQSTYMEYRHLLCAKYVHNLLTIYP